MANSQRHPIIANGEAYIESLIRKPRPNSHKFPHEYYEAKSRLWNDIDRIQQSIASSEEVFVEDKILCVRLEEKYEAKIIYAQLHCSRYINASCWWKKVCY